MENWAFPYQRNLISNKIEVVSQFEKLLRLKKFVEDLDVDPRFFVIHRDPIEGIVSLFVTAQNRIEKIYGPKYLNFNNFLSKYENEDKDYKNLKLFFDVYNIEKIKKIFHNSKLEIFNFNDIKKNPKKFINDFYNYLNLPIDYSLLEKITTKTGVTPLKKGKYFVKTPNFLFALVKKMIPKYFKDKLSFFESFHLLKKLLIKDYLITKEDVEKLTEILNEKNKNKN